MLSPDVLPLIKKYKNEGLLKEKTDHSAPGAGEFDWTPWINENVKIVADKTWYERNLMNYIYSK